MHSSISPITWLIAALLNVPRFSKAAGLLAARPVITPWPRRRPCGGGTLLFLNLGAPPRGTPPPGNDHICNITHVRRCFDRNKPIKLRRRNLHTPLRTAPAVFDETPLPWVNRPFFFLTGRPFTVACLLFSCCSFLFSRMMSSVKFTTGAKINSAPGCSIKIYLAS